MPGSLLQELEAQQWVRQTQTSVLPKPVFPLGKLQGKLLAFKVRPAAHPTCLTKAGQVPDGALGCSWTQLVLAAGGRIRTKRLTGWIQGVC